MAERQEIINAIQEGIERVTQTFEQMPEEQLGLRVHDGEGGWTARDILAHLAGRGIGYDRLFKIAEGDESAGFANFDVNTWNQERVDERAGRSRAELLEEFRNVHRAMIQRVESADDDLLRTKVASPRGELELGDALLNSAGRHSIMHAEEVEQAVERKP